MIPPISFLWRQLNGPQISAIVTSVFTWIKSSLDPKLNYWNKFSITTANGSHLTTIGALLGFTRPTIQERIKQDILFDSEVYNPSTNGFSPGFFHGPTTDEEMTGGRFSDNTTAYARVSQIPQEIYRTVLATIAKSEGEIGSLVLFDDILKALHDNIGATGYAKPIEGLYSFKYENSLTPGDIVLDIGRISDWPGSISTVAVCESICDGLYAPSPRIYVTAQLI